MEKSAAGDVVTLVLWVEELAMATVVHGMLVLMVQNFGLVVATTIKVEVLNQEAVVEELLVWMTGWH